MLIKIGICILCFVFVSSLFSCILMLIYLCLRIGAFGKHFAANPVKYFRQKPLFLTQILLRQERLWLVRHLRQYSDIFAINLVKIVFVAVDLYGMSLPKETKG